MADWSQQFHDLLGSPLGQELINCLKELRESTLADAAKAETMERAYGLLKEADGVNLAIGHLQSKAVVARKKGSEGA